ncbi:hypothetical protein [Vibrio diabolicus]|uniref:hypothetical protein n=1 Tax=Vibrio diabolicus TaxID=50719 RepID=UPI0029401E77|nr:hypothetical protein [Vibrio diabolicus]MDV5047630.1 hypothetical protein [Vibrio diabolicus]
MKFTTEDKVGRKLADTLGQELFSASDNYQTFMQCSMFLKTHDDRFLKVRAYLAYSNMLRSLYEYYIGIFKFRDGDTKQLSPDTVDQRMNKVARNLLNFYRPIEGFINPSFPMLFLSSSEKILEQFAIVYLTLITEECSL